jgi:hypothetical protein
MTPQEHLKGIELNNRLLAQLMEKSIWFIPTPYDRWAGEKGAQAPAEVYCETDEDQVNGTITLWTGVRVVVRNDGAVFVGTSRGINWQALFHPINETLEREGKTWQVLVDRTGRDLWLELGQYRALVAQATAANQQVEV